MGINRGIFIRARGFTFVEVIIVLIILGMAAALTLPFVGRSLDSIRNRAAVRRVASFLNNSRLKSVNKALPVEVVYDFDSRSFSQNFVDEKGEKSVYELPKGIRVVSIERNGESIEEGDVSIFFYPLGDSSGASILLAESDGREYRINVGLLFASPNLKKVK